MSVFNARNMTPEDPGQPPRRPFNPLEDDRSFDPTYDPTVAPPDQSPPVSSGQYPSALGQYDQQPPMPPPPGPQAPQKPGGLRGAASAGLRGGFPALLQYYLRGRQKPQVNPGP